MRGTRPALFLRVQAVEEATGAGQPFDVILMDMCMPVLGGVEATQVRCHAKSRSALWSWLPDLYRFELGGCLACVGRPRWAVLQSASTEGCPWVGT